MIDERTLLTTFVQRIGEAINNKKPPEYLDGIADLFNELSRRLTDDMGLSRTTGT